MHMEHKTITKLLQETGSEKTDLNTKLMLKTFFYSLSLQNKHLYCMYTATYYQFPD